MTRAQLPPSLPLAEDVRWRHALVYGTQTLEEAYQRGVFAERLRQMTTRATEQATAKARGSRSISTRLQMAYEQGVKDGQARAIHGTTSETCPRCGHLSEGDLRRAGQGVTQAVGVLRLQVDGSVQAEGLHLTPSEERVARQLILAYPSYATYAELLPEGRDWRRAADMNVVRTHLWRLGQKLKPLGVRIGWEIRRGYRLVETEAAS